MASAGVDSLLAAAAKTLDKTIEQAPAGFKTAEQWAKELGVKRCRAGEILRNALASGEWECVSVRIRTGMVVRPVPHYGPRRKVV
jgi:hypothetical protein